MAASFASTAVRPGCFAGAQRGARCVVRTNLGPHAVLHGLLRQLHLRHRQLRLRRRGVLRAGRGRLLRRQPRGRLQRADAGHAAGAMGCPADLNKACPADLRVAASSSSSSGESEEAEGEAVACRSACGAAQYCCSGAYGSPATCPPTSYSRFFKDACPRAYSYAYDDATSTFTCAAAGGVVFCLPQHVQPKIRRESRGSRTATQQWCSRATPPTV